MPHMSNFNWLIIFFFSFMFLMFFLHLSTKKILLKNF